jgi:hypothetical protein
MHDSRRTQRNSLQQLRDHVPALRDLEIELGHGGLLPGLSPIELVLIRLLAAPAHLRHAIVHSMLLDVARARRRRQCPPSGNLVSFAGLEPAEWRRDARFLLLLLRLSLIALRKSSQAREPAPTWALYDAIEEVVDSFQSEGCSMGATPNAFQSEHRGPRPWRNAWYELRLIAAMTWSDGGERPDPAARIPHTLLPYIEAIVESLYLDLPYGGSLEVAACSLEKVYISDEDLEVPRVTP